MNVLLIHPQFPETYWSLKYALRFGKQKASFPPLNLLTLASMMPKKWEKKLIDLNVEKLKDKHFKWADYVFIGAMDMQKKSTIEIIKRSNDLGIKVIAGGPFFTENYQSIKNVNHFVLGEAETTFPEFLKDLEKGTAKQVYVSNKFADIKKTPPPMWELIDMEKYYNMSIQYSRGCPFDCEFCQITELFGHEVRTKNKEQIIEELDLLYALNWRGPVFFVDDNLIGNKYKLKSELLPAIIKWVEKKGHPFHFFTQASINLSDDKELMGMMARAGFNAVFVGIETVDDDCLAETGKFNNRNRDLIASVKEIQSFGFEVWGGFIIGFDNDKPSNFRKIAQFIQESHITLAIVGILSAIKGTKLYRRLEKENRIILNRDDNNKDYKTNVISSDHAINFIPKMDKEILLKGYKRILKNIYSPKQYYLRIIEFLKGYNPQIIPGWEQKPFSLKKYFSSIKTLLKLNFILGLWDEGRRYYWKLFFWTIFKKPKLLPVSMVLITQGYHFRKVFDI